MRACSLTLSAWRSPMNRTRTLFLWRSSISRSMASRNSCIKLLTSTVGRCQFSLEKANSVSAPTPRFEHSSIHMRTGRTPSLWPEWRARPRASAHLPLPSMMMAMCCGMLTVGGGRAVIRSHLQEFFFLGGEMRVDIPNVLVGQLLDIDFGLLLFVLRDELFLERFLDVGDHVATHVAHSDARILGIGARHLGDVLATLFGERRQRDADDGARGHRVQAEVRFVDRFLDGLDHGFLPGRNHQRARVFDADVGHLLERRVGAVIVDLHVLDERRMRATRAQLLEIALEILDALAHAGGCVFLDVV